MINEKDQQAQQSVPSGYQGREQAYIKHELLKQYLERLMIIMGLTARGASTVELCYVDCFAGPWGDDSHQMATTSITISLAQLKRCQEILAARGINASFRALYIEEDPAAFERLQSYLRQHTPEGINSDCKRGDFVALRPAILEWVGRHAFAFFFIDPKGYSEIGVGTLRCLLERPHSEFLINLMYDQFNRVATRADWRDAVNEIIGGPLELPTGAPPAVREKKIVRAYRKSCKEAIGSAARSASVRVMNPTRDRSKYHLVYFTRHPKGITTFMSISEAIDKLQRDVRFGLQQEQRFEARRTLDMFADATSERTDEAFSVPSDIDDYWRDYIRSRGGTASMSLDAFADILEATDWFEGQLQASLARLIERGEVINLDAERPRRTRPLHYEREGERLRLLSK